MHPNVIGDLANMRQLNAMNKRVSYWTLPVKNYRKRLHQLELLPILFYQELKELLSLFNIISKK